MLATLLSHIFIETSCTAEPCLHCGNGNTDSGPADDDSSVLLLYFQGNFLCEVGVMTGTIDVGADVFDFDVDVLLGDVLFDELF